ncbi:exported hypothetical protein [Candidatus Sulfopaludibacter sp. SbA4]|nr:exported hypothetical protein [Candidatus Sulfopaludibacter sp. SbA4]
MSMARLPSIALALFAASAPAAAPFWIRVIDRETGRGVPLVQLSTPRDAIRFWTDSNGVAASHRRCRVGRPGCDLQHQEPRLRI